MPAILEKNKREISRKIRLCSDFAKDVQIDVVDGKFAPILTWPYTASFVDNIMKNYKLKSYGLNLELHLMVKHIGDFLKEYGTLSCKRAVFHVESEDFKDSLTLKEKYGFKEIGASLLLGSKLAMLAPYIDKLDFVQLMCIPQVGMQGSRFEDSCVNKVRELRNMYPDIKISLDGGVSAENIKLLKDAGAERFAVGSALFKSGDVGVAYDRLKTLIS